MYSYMNYSGCLPRGVFQNIAKVFIKRYNSPIFFFGHTHNFVIYTFEDTFFLERFYIMPLITEMGSNFRENIFVSKKFQRTGSSNGTYSCSLMSVAA